MCVCVWVCGCVCVCGCECMCVCVECICVLCLFKHVFIQYSICSHNGSVPLPLPPLPFTFQATQMEEAYGHYCKHYKANKDLIGGSRAESEFYRVSWAHCPFVLCGGRGGEGRGEEGRGGKGEGREGVGRGEEGRGWEGR